jgi:plasmid stabilization system protein ParE
VDYIARDSVSAALDWHTGIVEAIRTLRENPERCMLVPSDDILRIGLRRLLYGNYRILFTICDQPRTVNVLHVRHGARQDAESALPTREKGD